MKTQHAKFRTAAKYLSSKECFLSSISAVRLVRDLVFALARRVNYGDMVSAFLSHSEDSYGTGQDAMARALSGERPHRVGSH